MFQTFLFRSGKDYVSLKKKCLFFQGAMATLGVTGKSFTVYGFASGSNSKCARFFSKRFTSGTGGVDFFMQELSSEDFFWLFPPVNLLCKTVEHLALFRTSGVLLLSVWPKSSFFSYFFQVGALSLSFERV